MSEEQVVQASESNVQKQGVPEVPSYKGTKHKVKVNDQEQEWDYDRLIAEAQKGYASSSKWKEAKEMLEVVERFKKDPWAVAKEAGLDPYALAESLVRERISYESLSDEEKAKRQAEKERDEYKTKAEKLEEEHKERQKQEALGKVAQEIDEDIAEAIKELGFKPGPRVVARIAEMMLAELNAKNVKAPAKSVLPRVKEDLKQDVSEYLGHLPVEHAIELLPKPVLDAIRKQHVDAVKSQSPYSKPFKAKDEQVAPTKEDKRRMGTDDYFKLLEKKFSK